MFRLTLTIAVVNYFAEPLPEVNFLIYDFNVFNLTSILFILFSTDCVFTAACLIIKYKREQKSTVGKFGLLKIDNQILII